jgi:two-component system, response regulator
LEVLKEIKSKGKRRMIPVVVLTSSKEEKDMAASYKLGVNAYVVKPYLSPGSLMALTKS